MKGFRQQPEPSKKDKLRAIETEFQNSQMAMRISQLMTKQLMENQQKVQQDVDNAFGLLNELQYRVLAIQELTGVDMSALNSIVETLRLKDFTEVSDKEDTQKGLVDGTIVNADSTVILTSSTASPDKGIFRSKIKLSECGVQGLIDGLMGKTVGTKVDVTLNGVNHTVELLAIKQPSNVDTSTTENTVQ